MAGSKSNMPNIHKSTSQFTLGITPIEAILFSIVTAVAISLIQGTATLSIQSPWAYYLCITIAVYLITELLFFIYGKIRYTVLNRPITDYPDAKRVQVAMDRFLNLHSVFQLDEFLSGWFLGASPNSILRENVVEFVSYGFFCQKIENLGDGQLELVENFISTAEERWNITFPPGFNSELKYMAHVWEPLRVQHKPLAIYVATEFAAKMAHLLLRWMGFKKGHQGAFISWSTTNTNDATSNTSVDEVEGVKTMHSPREEKTSFRKIKSHGGGGAAKSPKGMSPAAHNVKEVAHNAAEHALDAAVAATSIAAASMAKQYPHEGQQYHLPPPRSIPRPRSSSSSFGSVPLIRSFKEISSMMERRVGLPESPRKKGNSSSSSASRKRSQPLATTPLKNNSNGAQVVQNTSSTTVPVVFLHGVGFGTLPYLHFIRSLMKACPQSPFILLEIPHVALRLVKQAESVDDVAAAAVAAVHKLGYTQACFIGHSYGTFCVSRIVQLFPEAVHSTALLDPVCMLTCYPQLLYNFIYRTFVVKDLLSSLLAAVDGVRFLCSRDLTISQAFCRRFHWSELMLWPEDLPREQYRSLIVLSGKDDLVPGELVQIQFDVAEHPARVLYHPELGHGGLLLDSQWMAVVVDGVKKMVYRGSSSEDSEEDAGLVS